MPYKARLKQGEPRKREKTGYRVTNAGAYNLSLKKRGMISLYFPSGELKAQFINARPYTRGALLNKSIFQPEGGRSGMIRDEFTCRRADAVQT